MGQRADAQNKPNFGGGHLAREGETCETKPNSGGLGHVGKGSHRVWGDLTGKWNVPNKPNFVGSTGTGSLRCKTNPKGGSR